MVKTYVVPLSLTSRLLATQLLTPASKPHILLPKHLIKSFLTENSTITYRNSISSLNSFQRQHTFPLSSTKHLERISRPFDVVSSMLNSYSSSNPISLIIPASQINPILNPKFQETAFVPPPNSDIFIVNPYFGQIEDYISSISSNYEKTERPRIWSIISTHLLSNIPFWGVEHQSIGEMKISYVPFEANDNDLDISNLLLDSESLQQILNTSSLLPQLEPYFNSNMLLAEQLIVEAALSPLLLQSPYANKEFLSISSPEDNIHYNIIDNDESEETNIKIKTTMLNIIEESIKVLKRSPIHESFLDKAPVFNSVLSRDRLFNLVLNTLYNDKTINNLQQHINSYRDLMKIRSKIYEDDMAMDEKFSKINRLRNPSRANKLICTQGLKYGIVTPNNKSICDKFKSNELKTLNGYNDNSDIND